MMTFSVNDMTCGHCVSTIIKAVSAIDPGARVQADVATHRVQIEPGQAGAEQLIAAIQQAGYTPVAIENAVGSAVAAGVPARKGGCCG
jgi:copper chaperone